MTEMHDFIAQKENKNIENNISYADTLSLIKQGKLREAEHAFRVLLKSNAKSANFLSNYGALLNQLEKYDKAISILKSSIAANPLNSSALINLGNSYIHTKRPKEALALYKQAIETNSSDSIALYNIGTTLLLTGLIKDAITHLERAAQLKPEDPKIHTNLGMALHEDGNPNDAIKHHKIALKINPEHDPAKENLAISLLLSGDYKEGLTEYEKRFSLKHKQTSLLANPSYKKWKYMDSVPPRKLAVVAEQGLGDTLQFMRYLSSLRTQGINATICASEKLHNLISMSGIDHQPISPQKINESNCSDWIPLLSLPHILEVKPENASTTKPYIKTDNSLSKKWNSLLSQEDCAIIGINWQGNPMAEKGFLQGRSFMLNEMTPLANINGFKFLSLQKGFGSEQLETCSFKHRFVSCQEQVNETWDFLETAAIIANCDLVITSDTSVAHLAGGMGKTTWLLLKKVPEWRWGLEGDTTFWYPSMRLFRQKERGNWNEVMERVAEALQEHFGGSAVPAEPTKATQTAIKQEPIQNILAPISLGELIDKITILQIKTQHLQGTALENVRKELKALEETLTNLNLNIDNTLIQHLKQVNQDLWRIEDDIRDQERQKSFGETFIELARSVYQKNDQRAAIKKEINTAYGSAFVEEKSYQQY